MSVIIGTASSVRMHYTENIERTPAMPNYPKKDDIKLWIPLCLRIFQSIMPPISTPYPPVYIATAKTFKSMREQLITDLDCVNKEFPEDSIMEYIHGRKGGAILIRQNLLPSKNDEHFALFFWHELGHFYAINSETDNFHHYSDPGLVDDSQIVAFSNAGPVVGWSDERKRQEGYWFWQEFIAEAISKYVSYNHRVAMPSYHPELITWLPNEWGCIVDKLNGLLDDALIYYPNTIDEYSLAHYFANLLMDDFIRLYVKAAENGRLKVYRDGDVVIPEEKIDPTCLDEIMPSMQKPLRKMQGILENQLRKNRFWEIDAEVLFQIGDCIGTLTLEKVKVVTEVNSGF